MLHGGGQLPLTETIQTGAELLIPHPKGAAAPALGTDQPLGVGSGSGGGSVGRAESHGEKGWSVLVSTLWRGSTVVIPKPSLNPVACTA